MTEQLIKEGWRMREISGFTQHVGPLWTRGSGKDAVFGLEVAEIHLNRRGHLHGGMLATLADNSLAMAVAAAVPGRPIATIQLNVQFVAPARLGDFIEAHCEVVRLTRSIIFMGAKLLVGTRTAASATGIWKILERG